MRKRMITAALAALALATALTGCATVGDGSSQLTGERWRKAELNTFDVLIISVDGKHHIERKGFPVIVDPGRRQIVVQGPPASGFSYGEQRTLTLDVKPCTLYFLEAKKANALAQDFEPRVNHTEARAGCTTK
jgi:hypothetical protein